MKLLNYINGQMVEPISQKWMDNTDPSTNTVFSQIPDSDERDVQMAVNAAKQAFVGWSTMPVKKRSDLLLRIAALIEKNLQRFAEAESLDNGKPVWLAKQVDIPRASANFHFYATAALHLAAETHAMENTAINYTLRQPIGIAGCISPWNLPLYLFTWKIAPALASGNCVVAKPSEITPVTAFLLSQFCIEAGLPAGVLNIIHGTGPRVGSAIVSHPDIPVISFTGGTKTGAEISRIAAPMFKKLSLELGGKNPNIIFEDCDFDHAVSTSIKSSFSNQGEICLCGSRIFIQRSIYDKFKEAFISKVKGLKTGDPKDESNFLGAIVSQPHFEKILSYIDIAKQEGGVILTGGKAIQPEGRCKDGFFIEPTVIENLPYNCRTNQEEIFGPVVTLTPFDTEEEVLMMANSTNYGLAATVWTTNLTKAHKVAAALHSGIVWINCWLLRDLRTPFGGVKQSGIGREGGFEALKFFTEEKNICIKL
ncbi:MAG TPA: aldehyde dehydrogenase [Bacteroidia bacterium]|nr:aldehyde dehydrogenase [Bacteroidia bacterium]MBP7713378.1 aldehyde dehydrogenase [Bacteroidia bacterium]MBP8667823.1 aldehyde dehydrogenase [Bacteroidia bacterium]HOZ82333.1 aldehyde dehydrogenase [Bacteroidia bacterium]HOZ90610.1 aldehyde dehydrogenase [Bacteroidia bacterium]